MPASATLASMTVAELLPLVADAEKGCKNEAMNRLLEMDLETTLPIFEQALRDDSHADLRNGAMEVITRFGRQAVPKLLTLLRDNNEEIRNFSTVMLGEIGSREAVVPLIQALRDTDSNVRHGAAEALGKINDRAALVPLLELLHEDFWTQYPAVSAIGAMKDVRAVPHLVKLLGNDLLDGAVIDALGEIGDPRALKFLGNMLDHSDLAKSGKIIQAIVKIYRSMEDDCRYRNCMLPGSIKEIISHGNGREKLGGILKAGGDPSILKAAVSLLGWLGEAAAIPDFIILLEDDDYLESVEGAILAIGKDAVPALAEALHHPCVNARIVAVRSLRWLGGEKELDLVVQLLSGSNEKVLVEVLASLKGIVIDGIVPRLFELLEDHNEAVSTMSAEVLGYYPYGDQQDSLRKMISSPDAASRRHAAVLIGSLRQSVPADALGILINDIDSLVRKEAIRAAGKRKTRKVFPLLQAALSDTDAWVKEEAISAVAEFGKDVPIQTMINLLGTASESLDYAVIKAAGKIGSKEAGAALLAFLRNGEISRCVEFALIDALGRIGYSPAVTLLKDRYLSHDDADLRRRAVQVLGDIAAPDSCDTVESVCRDPHWSVRIAALEALVKISGSRSLPVLLDAVNDPDSMVRKNALLLLGDLRDINAISSISGLLTEPELGKHAFEALLKFGRTALPWLHRIMKGDYQLEVRERVIELIGKIGDRKSIEPLLEMLDEANPSIRLAVIDSLVFCLDSVPFKKLVHAMKSDNNDAVRKKARLALHTLFMETSFS